MKPLVSLHPHDLKALIGRMDAVARKQVPFASSLALNKTGEDIMAENQKLMKRVFDRPTRWTLNAFYLKRSRKTDLNISVERKSMVGRKFYLEVQSEGGGRPKTGIERLFSDRLAYEDHIEAVLPTKALRRNKYGNVAPGRLQQILSGVRVQNDKAQNSTAASNRRAGARRARYFVPRPGGKLTPGVFERTGRRIKKVLAFTQAAPQYRAIFPMEEHGYKVARRVLPEHMKKALAHALATAK